MKKILFLVVLFVATSTSFAQSMPSVTNFNFDSEDAYTKAEPLVLECAAFLYGTPYAENNADRLTANAFIFRWMEGTSYTFTVDNKIIDIIGDNQGLLSLYMAGMSKVVLENKGVTLSDAEVFDRTIVLMGDYCKNPANNLKPTKKLKKLTK